jgi:L-amino acid N-acyltransferase YncA
MVVRRMRPEDVSAIHTIHTECLTRSLRERYSDEQVAAWLSGRTPEGYLRAQASGERYFVAEREGVVLGFASWQDNELLALFVHPDEQLKGVGTGLFAACVDDAVSEGRAITDVKATLNSIGFYERHEFTVVEEEAEIKRGVEIPIS